MKRKSRLLLLIPILLLTQAFSCKQYHSAVLAEHDFKLAVGAAQQIDMSEFNAGNLDPATHKAIEAGILKAALGGEQIAKLLQQNASSQSILAEIDSVNAGLQDMLANGLLGVKNPTTKQNLQASLQAVQAILANLKTFIAPAPTGGTQ